MVEGRVSQVTPAKRMSRAGSIAVDFDVLVLPDGQSYQIAGSLTSDDPYMRRRIDDESRISGGDGKNPVVFMGSGGAMGAILGGITGGLKGAAIGGAIGAGAGVASILLSKGEEADVPAGTPFGIQLRQALSVRGNGPAGDPGTITAPDPDPSYRDPSYRDSSQDPRDSSRDPRDPSDNPRDTSRDTTSDRDPSPGRDSSAGRDNSTRDPQPPASSGRASLPDPVTIEPPGYRKPAGEPADTDTTTGPGDATSPEPAPEPEPEPQVSLSSPEGIKRAQVALKEQGYYEGEADGVLSPRLTNALKTYQREHKLPQSGKLDEATARSLGINKSAGGSTAAKPTQPPPAARPTTNPTPARSSQPRAGNDSSRGVVNANVIGASARRLEDGSVSITIDTQANTGGWRWFGEHAVVGDALEVFAKAIPPTGMVTQALTRGKITMNVSDGVESVSRVIIHSLGPDRVIDLFGARAGRSRGGADQGRRVDPPDSPSATPVSYSDDASALLREAENLYRDYQRICNVRLGSSTVEVSAGGRDSDPEIELLFALDGFVRSAQLYTRLLPSLRERARVREATLSMARQARVTDRVVATSTSRCATQLAAPWDDIRQRVLALMKAQGIAATEIEP
jgi:hypothetical protein